MQFSVTTGTIFHASHVSLRVWLMVLFEMCSNKNGLAAREVERKYDLTPKTAWFVLQPIREAMKLEPMAGLLTGLIVADATFIGELQGTSTGRARRGRARRRVAPGTRTTRPRCSHWSTAPRERFVLGSCRHGRNVGASAARTPRRATRAGTRAAEEARTKKPRTKKTPAYVAGVAHHGAGGP